MNITDEHIDPAALERHLRLAIAGQKHQDDIDELLDAMRCGEVDVLQPDDDGYLIVKVGGHPVLRAHWTRLLGRLPS